MAEQVENQDVAPRFYEIDQARIARDYTYHPPKGNQAVRYGRIRGVARALAEEVMGCTPPSREQSLALTHLDEVVMFANAAIARNE